MRPDLVKFYDEHNQPDPASADFRNVIDWLKAHGAPEPTVTYYFLDNIGYPNGGNPGKQMLLTFGPEMLAWTSLDAADVMNTPGAALLVLGLSKDGILYEPPSPPVMPSAPVTQPENPIGVFWYATREGLKIFQPAVGDALPDGKVWPDPATNPPHLYLKSIVPMFAGSAAYWTQLR